MFAPDVDPKVSFMPSKYHMTAVLAINCLMGIFGGYQELSRP